MRVFVYNVQVRNIGENCAGKFYLHKAVPAHCLGKFNYTLFSVLRRVLRLTFIRVLLELSYGCLKNMVYLKAYLTN